MASLERCPLLLRAVSGWSLSQRGRGCGCADWKGKPGRDTPTTTGRYEDVGENSQNQEVVLKGRRFLTRFLLGTFVLAAELSAQTATAPAEPVRTVVDRLEIEQFK